MHFCTASKGECRTTQLSLNTIRPWAGGLVCLRDVVPPGERERRFGPVDDAVIVYIICTRTRICVLGQVWVATRKGGGRRVLPRGEVVVFIGPRPRVVVAGGDRMPSREGERRSLLFSDYIAHSVCTRARNVLLIKSLSATRERE
eukprot:XP_001708590.1 Hypothetical protein GL50803_32359 [Giardia lamblia ATCC 50803]